MWVEGSDFKQIEGESSLLGGLAKESFDFHFPLGELPSGGPDEYIRLSRFAGRTEDQYRKMIDLGLGELDKSGIAELTFPERAGA
jgi:hypothetical protein